MTKGRMGDLEIMQNNALRIIFKINQQNDHVTNESLRALANVETIKDRHTRLMNNYLINAINTGNPLLLRVFEEYRLFKEINEDMIDIHLAYNIDGTINYEVACDFLNNNKAVRRRKSSFPTILCYASDHIKNLILKDG